MGTLPDGECRKNLGLAIFGSPNSTEFSLDKYFFFFSSVSKSQTSVGKHNQVTVCKKIEFLERGGDFETEKSLILTACHYSYPQQKYVNLLPETGVV